MPLNPESTKEQKDALSEALFQHANRMGTMGANPEDIPEGFTVPTYSKNLRPLYDNQLFPAVSNTEDLMRVGYATPDGQITQEGQMAVALKNAGGLNDDYTLNDAGRAMLSNRADLLEPENLILYGKSEELNLDDDGRGAMARFSLGAQELWNSTKNLVAALYEEAEPALGAIKAVGGIAKGPAGVVDVISGVKQQLETDYTPEQRAATRIRTEEAIKEFSDQGAYTLLGAGELMMRGAMASPISPVGIAGGSEVDIISQAQKDENILATRQARERVLNDAANVSVSEAVDQLTGVTEFVKSYQQAAELLGPERTKELQAQGKAIGLGASVFNPATPEAIAFGVGFKVARGITAPISGAWFRAEQKASRVLAKTEELTALQKQAADYQFAIKTVEQQAARAEETAARLSKRGFVDRANSATTSANAIRRKAQEAGVKLGGLNDEIARVSDDLATLTKDATVADKFNQMLQKAKEVPYMPITAVGQGLEYVGRGMIGIDKGLSKLASKIGVDKAYNAMNKITSLSGLGAVGSAAGLGPVAFIPAAIKTAWSTAPFIQGAGRFINLVGKEAMKARADIDFWKRIYAMPNQGPVNRAIAGLMDTVTLGGRVTDFGVRTTKGILAAVPADLAFQYVAEGGKMDAGSIGEALSESVFFGGAGGGLGAITMGSKQKIRSLQNGNALNFYRTLEDPQQRILFNGMPEDYRRAIGTFSATNPGARVVFTTIGGGGIDPNTNTIYINPNSSNPIKPLVTHEFMHHMMNNGIGEAIVAQLVGDGYQTGGILRTADGKYEPQYEAFKEEYVDRLRQQHAQMIKMREAVGDKIPASEREFQPPSEKYLAEEYFIESNVEDMLGLVESGKLGKMAGRMIINDKVRALGDAILNKSSILRDLHFKLGGVMDKNGKMVSGNGFLGGQMYQSPEIRRMFKKMVSDSVGRKGGFDKARIKAKEGVKLKINSKTDPILRSMVSLWEGDADGVPFLDKDGDYIPLKKETEEMRATAGLLLIDDQNRRQANGEAISEGQLVYNPDTQTWSGKYLTDDQIRILRLSGRFNNPQIRQLEMLNEAAKATLDPNAAPETRGNRFSIIYQAALKRNKKGKWRYDQIEPSLRDVVPYGVEISKAGNISIRIMSTNQMHANISKKAASKKGIQLYEGNIEAILRDVNKVIELHGEAEGKPTDAYFKEKYGAAWESHKAFINSVFGNVGAGHKDINPLVASDKVDAVVKTYRLDRINKATQMVGSTNLPYQNNLVKINYLPEGEPILDENGEPKDLRYTPSYEDSQVRMPEAQRAMPEGEQAPTRFIPEQLDSDYMKAVESGDVEAQQRMVDEAAKSAGYEVGPLWHGSNSSFNVFDKKKAKEGRFGKGFYFTPNESSAKSYGEESVRSRGGELTLNKFYLKPDVFNYKNTIYVASDPSQIKSADPITRDNSGKVIPLSKRFDVGSRDIRYMPEATPKDGNAGIKEPVGSLGDLRKNVEIPKTQLPLDVLSVPKYVARETKDGDWKVMEGANRIARGNFQTPLPNAQVKKTKEFSTPKQDIISTASEARQVIISNKTSVDAKQQAVAKVNSAIDKINNAVMDADNNPEKFVDVKGYAEIMKNAGVTGDILVPPSSLRTMLYKPDDFVALLDGGYHGDKTVAGIRDAAMSGLDAVVEMRELIGSKPPDLVTALHHLWGTLSKQLPPLQQEALWMRMIVNKDVMEQIGRSIDGTFNLSPDQWKQIVLKARANTKGTYGKLGENATSNANSFYLMLAKHNGKWNEVSNVYATDDAVDMRYKFNTLGHGATGIKNKVQSFIGLTFGIKGNVLDRWRFVDMFLDDAMKITGAKTPREYFKYEGKSKNVPVDKIGIYKNYGTIENGSPLFSLALYSAMDRVSQRAIDASPALQKILGNHADPGGLHWLSWNAIKNEAVGHSSLDITKNFIKKYKKGDNFDNLTVDNFVDFVNNTEAFVEGTSGAGDEITRLTLKNGVFNYSKR